MKEPHTPKIPNPDVHKNPAADRWNPFARARELANRMVRWNSETGTPGEAEFAFRLRDLLLEIPYFHENPEDIVLLESHGDPVTYNLVALVRGTGKRAMALAGHFDTVSIANYHELADLACEPEALRDALLADLRSRQLSDQEARALADLESGDFEVGRGMLDMKSGLAAGIAVLERFANDPDRQGNLILLATPDEERESRGMRSLREALSGLMQKEGLEIEAAINMDVTSDRTDGSAGRAIYAGTIGKLLPFAFTIGLPSHAAYPFEGISAQLIGAEILRAIEGNAELADTGPGDVSPPPICLEARDLREGYEVTTPERFWLCFNWLYHSGSAAERFDRFRAEVEGALVRATDRFRNQSHGFAARTGILQGADIASPLVKTIAELKAQALTSRERQAEFSAFQAGLAKIDNPLTISRACAEWLINSANIKGPSVIIGFAGLHYPPCQLDRQADRDAKFIRAIEAAQLAFAERAGASTTWRPHFQGISDMSFLGQPIAAGGEVIVANTAASRLVDDPDMEPLAFPVVNIGPWGRELHQKLERVYSPYAFDILPRFLAHTVTSFLGKAE